MNSIKIRLKLAFILFFVLIISIGLFAYDPVSGGDEKNKLQSTTVLGGQGSTTGGAFGDSVPGSLAINPALAGAEQRPILDVSYFLLAGLKQEKGFGHIANLGVVYPFRWGNLAGSAQFLNSEFNSLKLGTLGSFRFSYSKDLTDKLLIGLGTYFEIGKDWGVGLDIGGLYKFGDLGFLKDFKLGISFTGLGKNYNTKVIGIKGQKSSGAPGIVTPHIGFATTLVKIDGFKLGMHFDASAPFFQNFVFNTGLHMEMADMLSFKTGFVFNTLETIHKKQSYFPSLNIGINIKINSSKKDKNSFMHRQGWEQSEIKPEFSAKPFYNGIWAFGAGVNMHLGLKDEQAPNIELKAEPTKPIYFSPNNDGEVDAMEIPLKITDKRFVTAWSAEIKDEKGNTVRTIENKTPLREMKDVKSFFKLLGKSKSAVEVPPVLRWDGRTDAGEIAPDGKYTFTVKAKDDNKNKGETSKYIVFVDKTYPEIKLEKPKNIADYIFSPDGDGNKDDFIIENTGSKEDLWTANIQNKEGNIVRTLKIENDALTPIKWDGKNNSGEVVTDGVYKYTIESIDKAKNKTTEVLSNIIVDTNKPSINIAIDKKAFSPKLNLIEFKPSIPVKTGLVEWTIDVKDENNSVVKTYTGNAKNIRNIEFNGKDSDGNILKEGKYKAFISAKYLNGHNPKTETPSFELDVTPPEAVVSVSEKLFSPDGDGKLDSVIFKQEEKQNAKKWIAEIYKATSGNNIIGEPIYRVDFGKTLPSNFEWTGRNTDGAFAKDGKYAYILKGVDEAKNSTVANTVIVELNTEKADIILQSNYTAFSPNNDSIKDTLELYPKVKSKTKVANYLVTIKNESGAIVKTISGTTPPKKIIWDGKGADNLVKSDGLYTAEFEVELENKQTANSSLQNILVDREFPKAEISAPYLVFSPRQGNSKNVLPITQISSDEDLWTGKFIDENNNIVKTITWRNKLENFEWLADDNLGNKVPNGIYSFVVESEDKAGNKTTQKLKGIVVDDREVKGYIQAKLPVFSPTGNGVRDTQELSILTNIDAEVAEWAVKVSSVDDGSVVAEWGSDTGKPLVKSLKWNGINLKNNKIAQNGNYMATAYIEYKKGDIVTAFTEPFILATKPANLSVSLKPKYFSPDNDGIDDDLFIGLKVDSFVGVSQWKFEINEPESSGGKLFWKTSGKEKITDEIIWDGRSLDGETVQSATDYPFTFTVKDKAGLISVYKGYIPVDILVIRDGDKLKIAVPSIIFRGNAADFKGLDTKIVDKNNGILKRVAQILNKFPEYKVTVEGHANATSGTKVEEEKYLLPLSSLRAEAVKNILIKHRVKKSRLSSIGMGGTQPVVSIDDKDNWWKNRRVEFVLIKPQK